MNLSTWALRNPVATTLLFVLLSVAGLAGFKAMKVQAFPDIDLPTVVVVASLPGASPAHIETEIARKLENSIATLQGIRHVYTTVQDGTARITVRFRLERTTQQAVEDVREAVSRVRSDMPAEMRDPLVSRVDVTGTPILVFAVESGRWDAQAISWFVDNELTKALLAVKGVGSVTRVGGSAREIMVALDPLRLQALNATAADVSRQLKLTQREAAGGRTELGTSEQSVRTVGSVESAEQLGALQIALSDGRRIRLEQVAQVHDTVPEPRSAAFLDGKPMVAFEIVRSKGAGEVEVADGVAAALGVLQAAHSDLKFVEVFNQVDRVQDNYSSSMRLLYEGALLAVVVVFVFLRDWRATLVAATALPLSVVPAFGVMAMSGFTINIVTLLGLSLVVGVLVDDAIVEIENIMRHLAMGKPPLQAARDAAEEIGLAVVATSFTLVAVFLPTAFMAGVSGKFFVQFGWTSSIAVLFSLLVARMLTPLIAAHVLALPTAHAQPAWVDMLVRWVASALDHRWRVASGVVAFTLISFVLVARQPSSFIPPDDLSQTQVTLSLAPGSTLNETAAVAEMARTAVASIPYVEHVYTAVGGGSAGADAFSTKGSAETRQATLTVTLAPRPQRHGVTKQQIESQMRLALQSVPGARVKVGFGTANDKYAFVLAGEDGALLNQHARLVERDLRTLQGVGAVTSSLGAVRPEVVVRTDFARAADLGVNSSAIADTLRIALSGDYEQSLPRLNLPDRQLPVVVRLASDARRDMNLLQRLSVPGSKGPVKLASVADVGFNSGPAEIDRYDRLRNVGFEVELNGLALGEVQRRSQALPSLSKLPAGLLLRSQGDAEAMAELFQSFGAAILTGVLCIYLVLVLLFRDFLQPVTILVALVLTIPGAFLSLCATGTAISMPSMIGMIMLMGIATKNSILLVDYALHARREKGLDRTSALLDACRKRARPVVMTSVAMMAGMLPIALGVGTDPTFRSPMAIVVIGGLATSTFLSLLVVPVVFTWIDDVADKMLRFRRTKAGIHVAA